MGDGIVESSDTQAFVLHNAPISDNGEYSSTVTACAMLLDAPVVPLLATTLQAPPPGPCPPVFYVSDAGTKGAGMFAAQDIPAGALIVVDQPITVVPSGVRNRAAFDVMLPRISQPSRERLLALANCKPLAEYPVIEGIALTNAIQIELPVPPAASPQEYGAVFPSVSRANHSCGLQSAVKWDPASFSVSMYALRPYRKGEEIFNQYIDVLAPRAVRQAQLARYGFTCACTYCAAPSAASDAARAELRDWRALHPRFMPWATDMCRADDTVITASLRALALIDQEGIYGLQVLFFEDLALSYAVLGDEARFRHWAQKVVDICAGQDPERAARFAGWMAEPRTYKLWGWRAKQRLILEKLKKKEPDDVDISIPW